MGLNILIKKAIKGLRFSGMSSIPLSQPHHRNHCCEAGRKPNTDRHKNEVDCQFLKNIFANERFWYLFRTETPRLARIHSNQPAPGIRNFLAIVSIVAALSSGIASGLYWLHQISFLFPILVLSA